MKERYNFRISSELLKKVKEYAKKKGGTVTEVIIDAVTAKLINDKK